MLRAALAEAQEVFTYTGHDFNTFSGTSGDTTSNFISVTLDFPSILAVNTNYFPIDPASWSITDGTHTLSSAGGNFLEPSSVTTNAGGNILFWSLTFSASDPTDPVLQTSNVPGVGALDMFTDANGDTAGISSDAGSWNVAQTPEPGTIGLTRAGILALIAGYRHRRKRYATEVACTGSR